MQDINPTNLSPQAIRIFLCAADAENFTAAAAQLNVTQPLVSRTIAQLEHDLGIQLFSRIGKRVVLTEAGAFLRERWSMLYDYYVSSIDEAGQVSVNSLAHLHIADTIFLDKNLYLFPILKRFETRFPDLKTEIDELGVMSAFNAVNSGNADIGFSVIDENFFENTAIEWRSLIEVPTTIDIPPTMTELYEKTRISTEDLNDIPIGLLSPSQGHTYNRDITSRLYEIGIKPTIVHYAPTLPSLYAQRNFNDFAVVGHPFVEEPRYRRNRRVTVEGCRGTTFVIYWNKDRIKPLTEAFIDEITQYFAGKVYRSGAFMDVKDATCSP